MTTSIHFSLMNRFLYWMSVLSEEGLVNEVADTSIHFSLMNRFLPRHMEITQNGIILISPNNYNFYSFFINE